MALARSSRACDGCLGCLGQRVWVWHRRCTFEIREQPLLPT